MLPKHCVREAVTPRAQTCADSSSNPEASPSFLSTLSEGLSAVVPQASLEKRSPLAWLGNES